jgi:3-oxoacyl-[acyl-carrier-protein] synthase II
MGFMAKGDFLITGLGSVSAAGENLESSLASVGAGTRNSGPVSIFSTSLSYPVFEYKGAIDPSMAGRRTLALLMKAVGEALLGSGLQEIRGKRVGICIGTTVACQLNDLDFYRSYRENGNGSLWPVDLFLKGNPAEFLSRELGTRGPALSIVNACSSGTDAIGVALSWLKSGLCDIAIAGGADELNLIPYAGFSSLGILNPGLCAPFDRDRKGLNLGEGAGIMVIEKRSSALARGVRPTLFLAGYGLSGDAYHLTAPSPQGIGLRSAVNGALSEAGIAPEEISFVNSHGTGTQDNDLVEGNVLADIFGPDLVFLSTKGYTGHTLGAAGGIEAVFSAAGLREGWIPASAGFALKDENIPVSPVKMRTEVSGEYALSTSLAFGGNNAAVVIGLER